MSTSSNIWTDDDIDTLRGFAAVMGEENFPLWLVQVMSSESGCLPDPKHNGPARGLIQFEPETLRGLGWKGTPDSFSQQPVADQLPYVLAYFKGHRQSIHSLADTYVCNFLPAYTGVPTRFRLCGIGGPLEWAYKANSAFDTDKKGFICPADLAQRALKAFSASAIAQDIASRAGFESVTLRNV